MLNTWHQRSPEAASAADRRVQDDILRTTELSTFAIVDYLSNGQVQSEDHARFIAATGKAPLRDTIALAELTKLYLYWRDITITVLTDEGRGARPGIGPHPRSDRDRAWRFGWQHCPDGKAVRLGARPAAA